MAKLDGKALTAIGIGSIFIWSGIKGWSILGTVGDLIKGNQPKSQPVNALVDPNAATDIPGQITGSNDLAAVAIQYVGHAYEFGGAPGKDGSKPWDCSSFVNWIVSVKMGLAIPGYGPGKYDGSSHGPPTGGWGVWNGIRHISRGEVQSGDLIVWVGHMGIAINNQQMVSALNPNDRTKITPIEGYGNGPIICYGRYGNAPSRFN